MNDNDSIDIEEIECRLYSQIYHSNAENEEIIIPSESNIRTITDKIHNNNRYFSKAFANLSGFIPLEEENRNKFDKTLPSIHNSVSVNPKSTDITTKGNFGNQFQNNITVNQYTVPLIINPELNGILNPGKFFVPWSLENKNLVDKKIRKREKLKNRRRKNKEKKKQNSVYNTLGKVKFTQSNAANHIVYISDDSDKECIVAKESKQTIISVDNLTDSNILNNIGSESDDDIIYVPPPPVEIINVDFEEDKSKTGEVSEATVTTTMKNLPTSTDLTGSLKDSNCQSSGPVELLTTSESCIANDFLENSGVENSTSNFNFSLHGSDFTNTGDFVRPANPVDYCETESSCSTNDFNKESNSVKTIVFNEVDFPKEDIFSDKNLEGFSTYITPKRNTSKISKVTSKSTKSSAEMFNDDETSSSSSESDYEPSCTINTKVGDEECNKRLPTLSPMQCGTVTATNTKLSKNKPQTSSSRKDFGKRKSNTFDTTESDCDNDEESELTRKLLKKKKKGSTKKKNSADELDKSINIDLQNKNSEMNTDAANSNCEETVETNVSEKRVKKKIKNPPEKGLDKEKYAQENNDAIVNTDIINRADSLELINEGTDNINTDIVNTSRKKKKKVLNLGETTFEKVKRKKKRTLSSENSIKDITSSKLNQSYIGNADIDNTVNEPTQKNNLTSYDNKINSTTLDVVSDKSQEKEQLTLSTRQIENKIDSTIESKQELQNIGEDSVETVKKIFPNSLGSTLANVSQENECDEEIIVVDEVGSHTYDANVEDCIEIIESSDSDYDFKDLEDVGQNLELANCSVTHKNFINDDAVSYSPRSFVKNKNLCEDYSKFDVQQIQGTQSDDPEVWKISPRDRLIFLNPSNSKGPRCNRCRQFGHVAVKCTEKPDPPNCSLCGFSDHQEPRCPNKRCTQCGNEGDYSTTYCWKCVRFRNMICRICNLKGHIAKTCPDLWRRYHLTTQEGPIVIPQGPQLKPRDQLWCSGCAKQGHLEHECNYYNREYMPTNPCIFSYEDVLQEGTSNPPNTTPSPPPPPIWNIQSQNNFYRNVPSYPNFPSTSQNIPYSTPIFIPPLIPQMPTLNPIFPVSTMIAQNEIMIPSPAINCNPHFAPLSTRVLNPFSVLVRQESDAAKNIVLDQMMLNYVNSGSNINYLGSYESEKGKVIHPHMIKHGTNEFLKNDQRKVKQIIMSAPPHVVKQFLRKELDELENVVSKSDPKYLRKKLFRYDRISQGKRVLDCGIIKEKCFWYRILNMFIFGVHQFKDGKMHISYIGKYLSESKHNKLDSNKRKSLLSSYNYIFDANRHFNVNYYRIIQQVIDKHSEQKP